MVLSKNNTKGNEVLLQNIVLKKRKKEKGKRKKNHTEKKEMGHCCFTYTKALWYMALSKSAACLTLLNDQEKDRSHGEDTGRNF